MSIICFAQDGPPMPNFTGNTQEYIHKHKITNLWDNGRTSEAEDKLIIGDITEKDLKFSLLTFSTNSHTCGVSGHALFDGTAFLYSDGYCKLTLTLNGNTVNISNTGNCSGHCGSMGKITNSTYVKM